MLPPPLTCNAYPIAILLHGLCTICTPPPTPPLYAIHHTLLVMATARAFSTRCGLAFTRYCYYQYCMVYGIDTGRREGRILPNSRAIVYQGGQCRWAREMKGWLNLAQQPQSERISCNGQGAEESEIHTQKTPLPPPYEQALVSL